MLDFPLYFSFWNTSVLHFIWIIVLQHYTYITHYFQADTKRLQKSEVIPRSSESTHKLQNNSTHSFTIDYYVKSGSDWILHRKKGFKTWH